MVVCRRWLFSNAPVESKWFLFLEMFWGKGISQIYTAKQSNRFPHVERVRGIRTTIVVARGLVSQMIDLDWFCKVFLPHQ